MSKENLELARAAFDHFVATGEPEWAVIDDLIEVHDHDIMDGEEYRGHEGVARWLSDWATAWSGFSVEREECIDAGGENAIVVFRLTATGVSSGIEVDRQDALVHRLRDGKVVRLDYYNSRQQALQAVGLAG